jgi:hypothetical protein
LLSLHLATHVLDHDSADSEGIGSSLRVCNLGVLVFVLAHNIMHVLGTVVEDIVQAMGCQDQTLKLFENADCLQFDRSLSRAHTENHTEADVLCLLNDVLTSKQVDDLEKLTKVKLLLAGNNIKKLVIFVMFVLHVIRA